MTIIELRFQEMPGGQITVPVRIGAAGELPFVIDTGASATVISPATRQRLGLVADATPTTDTAYGAGGSREAVRYVIPSMSVGGEVVHDQPVFETSLGDQIGDSIAGVLGRDFLARHVVEIDFTAKRVRLHPPGTPVPEAVPFTDAAEGLIKIAITLDGRDVPAVLDLGASASIVNTAAAGPATEPAGSGERSMALGADGNPVPLVPRTFDVKLGAHDLGATRLYVGDLAVFPQLGLGGGPAAIVGLDLVGKGTVWIDFTARRFALLR
jgi:predicted aspartyl protease